MRNARTILAVALSAGAAYAFSFAIDLLFGAFAGVYPATAYLPVVTWSIIAVLLLAVSIPTALQRVWLALPFAIFGVLALFGAIVGTHPHSYAVALFLFLQAAILWLVFRKPSRPLAVG